jgi:rhodanese-related sulfurtransferase
LTLPDETEVYPAHGAGSMCGKNLSSETSSTIGQQRKFNYALQPMTKEQFVAMMLKDLSEAPVYFSKDAEINRAGAAALNQLPAPSALSPAAVEKLSGEGHVILDVRSAAEFGAGHVPGSLNIGLGGQFASWAGSLIAMDAPIIIIADSDEKVSEAQVRLARVGLENVKGYLAGGIDAWKKSGAKLAGITQISVADLRRLIEAQPALQLIDVRRAAEYQDGHAPGAITAPLIDLRKTLPKLPLNPSQPTAVICAGGYRSSAATSILEQFGFANLTNVTGGTKAWIDAGYPVET